MEQTFEIQKNKYQQLLVHLKNEHLSISQSFYPINEGHELLLTKQDFFQMVDELHHYLNGTHTKNEPHSSVPFIASSIENEHYHMFLKYFGHVAIDLVQEHSVSEPSCMIRLNYHLLMLIHSLLTDQKTSQYSW